MKLRALTAASALALALAPGIAHAAPGLFHEDGIGPILDVTSDWQHYQPASAFCIQPDVPEYAPGGTGATDTGADPVCRFSGFAPNATGLVRVAINTPVLCATCRRLFIDFSQIPQMNRPPLFYAHGHVYCRLTSANLTYTAGPTAHSPNTKNFTNDKLLAPSGTVQEQLIALLDLHQAFGYTTDTAHFVHSKIQGPYYIGPWYVNRAGQRINGIYLDVNLGGAIRLPSAQLNAIGYGAGFNSGVLCTSDADAFYVGCVDWFGLSVSMVDPWAAL